MAEPGRCQGGSAAAAEPAQLTPGTSRVGCRAVLLVAAHQLAG